MSLMSNNLNNGFVFNIERYGIEDGPGIRTVVFLKGCALRCKWCANPESQLFTREILYNKKICKGCGKCIDVCKQGHIEYNKELGFITTNNDCGSCTLCVDMCPTGAREIMGTEYTPEQLCKVLLRDEPYYKKSGGGITFSGGEPLFQIDFIEQCYKILNEYNISILVETCGFIPMENIKRAADICNEIFIDFKQADSAKHKELTGEDNLIIKENIEWLCHNYKKKLSIRYPYIPECNDDDESIRAFFEFIVKQNRNDLDIVFLPYHRLGIAKYEGLGRVYDMGNRPSLRKSDLKYLENIAKEYNIKITI